MHGQSVWNYLHDARVSAVCLLEIGASEVSDVCNPVSIAFDPLHSSVQQ